MFCCKYFYDFLLLAWLASVLRPFQISVRVHLIKCLKYDALHGYKNLKFTLGLVKILMVSLIKKCHSIYLENDNCLYVHLVQVKLPQEEQHFQFTFSLTWAFSTYIAILSLIVNERFFSL
jgi:hypothetical protein